MSRKTKRAYLRLCHEKLKKKNSGIKGLTNKFPKFYSKLALLELRKYAFSKAIKMYFHILQLREY